MANKTLATNTVGTFKIQYSGEDEAGNITTKDRNVFILPVLGEPSLVLNGPTQTAIIADSGLNNIVYTVGNSNGDPGYEARDQYNNLVNHFVRVQHYRHRASVATGVLIYDSDDLVNYNNPINNDVDPEDLWFFDFVSDPPPRDPPLEPSYTDLSSTQLTNWGLANYNTYFRIKYTLTIPGVAGEKVQWRTIHIKDWTAPLFSFEGIGNKSFEQGQQTEVNAYESGAVDKYKYQENYWFIDGKLPIGYSSGDQNNERIGFTVEDVKYTHPNYLNEEKDSIDANVKGVWTAHHRFKCSYSINVNNNDVILNYIPDSTPTDYENTNKLYELKRTVTISADNENPVIKFLQIDTTYGGDGTIKTESGGGTDHTDSNAHGTIVITVPTQVLAENNSSDDISLAEVLEGDTNDDFKNASSEWTEIEVTDNVGIQSITYTITQQSLNFNASQEQMIKRTHLGTDFSSLFDSITNLNPKAIGTPANPAIFIIKYIAIDTEGNGADNPATRTIKVIDSTAPVVNFVANSNDLYGNALTFNKNQGTNNQVTITANNNSQTTISDNFGDEKTLTITDDEFRQAYPKNYLDNIFKVKKVDNGYKITDLYDQDLTGIQYLYTNKSYNVYYFDLSDPSLSVDQNNDYRLFNGGNLILDSITGISYNVSYTKNGSYNAYMSIDAGQVLSGSNNSIISIRKETSSNTYTALNLINSVEFRVSTA